MKPTIHIHIGAHKTATTFLQHAMVKLLAQNPRAGAYTLPLWNMRQSFSSPFSAAFKAGRNKGVHKAKEELLKGLFNAYAGTGLDSYVAGNTDGAAPVCIVSDENLLGHLVPILRNQGLYSEAGPRLVSLMDVFSGYDVKVFMAIRNYRDFYPSAFAQSIKRVPKLSMEKFTENLKKQERGWVEVAADVANAVGKDKLVIWRYEDFAAHPSHAFNVLAPGLKTTDKEIREQSPKNLSLGRKALDCIQRLQDILNAEELKTVSRLLQQVDFKDDEKVKIDDTVFAEQLAARYEVDHRALVDKGYAFVV